MRAAAACRACGPLFSCNPEPKTGFRSEGQAPPRKPGFSARLFLCCGQRQPGRKSACKQGNAPNRRTHGTERENGGEAPKRCGTMRVGDREGLPTGDAIRSGGCSGKGGKALRQALPKNVGKVVTHILFSGKSCAIFALPKPSHPPVPGNTGQPGKRKPETDDSAVKGRNIRRSQKSPRTFQP